MNILNTSPFTNKIIFILIWIIIIILVFFSKYWYYLTKQEIIDYISQQTIIKEVKQDPEVITIFVEREQMNSDNYSNVKLNTNYIYQNPELPTGCEVTALTIILNY